VLRARRPRLCFAARAALPAATSKLVGTRRAVRAALQIRPPQIPSWRIYQCRGSIAPEMTDVRVRLTVCAAEARMALYASSKNVLVCEVGLLRLLMWLVAPAGLSRDFVRDMGVLVHPEATFTDLTRPWLVAW